jgi:hypothetical protein
MPPTEKGTTATMFNARSLSFILCVGLLATAANAGSVTLYDNLGATTDGADGIDPTTGLGPLADSFSTGSSNILLSDVKALLGVQFTGTGPGPGSVTAYLLSNNANTPGSVLTSIGTVTDQTIFNTYGTGTGVIDFAVSSFSLAANTRYWIELADTPGKTSVAFWSWSLDTSGQGVAGEFLSNGNGTVPNPGNGPYQMEVTATSTSVIPEPSSVVLLGLGIGGITVQRRFRNRRHA